MKYVVMGAVSLFAVSVVIPTISQAEVTQNPNKNVCFAVDSNLGVGSKDKMTNGSVINLQAFLHGRGYLKVAPTGYFGVLTREAVKTFQKENKIPPTGFAGVLTRAKMKELTCANQLEISVTPEKTEYKKGEDIKFKIRAENTSDDDAVVSFTSSCETMYVIDNIYNSLSNHACAQIMTSRTIEAGKSYSWLVTHDPAEFAIATGTHTIAASVINYGSATTSVKVIE